MIYCNINEFLNFNKERNKINFEYKYKYLQSYTFYFKNSFFKF